VSHLNPSLDHYYYHHHHHVSLYFCSKSLQSDFSQSEYLPLALNQIRNNYGKIRRPRFDTTINHRHLLCVLILTVGKLRPKIIPRLSQTNLSQFHLTKFRFRFEDNLSVTDPRRHFSINLTCVPLKVYVFRCPVMDGCDVLGFCTSL
jgi:hypothetical protein